MELYRRFIFLLNWCSPPKFPVQCLQYEIYSLQALAFDNSTRDSSSSHCLACWMSYLRSADGHHSCASAAAQFLQSMFMSSDIHVLLCACSDHDADPLPPSQCWHPKKELQTMMMQLQMKNTPNTYVFMLFINKSSASTPCTQFQGAVICLLLGAGWGWSGVMRQREVARQRAAHPQRQRSNRGTPASANPGYGHLPPVSPARAASQNPAQVCGTPTRC